MKAATLASAAFVFAFFFAMPSTRATDDDLVVNSQPVSLHSLEGHEYAQCLDGSPAAYFYRPAYNASYEDKWVIALQGGGECVEEQACLNRSSTDLGSSANYSAGSLNGTELMTQFQDARFSHNPDFFGWHHVLVPYCTGDLWLGEVREPDPSLQWGWARFSGAFVVDAVLTDLGAPPPPPPPSPPPPPPAAAPAPPPESRPRREDLSGGQSSARWRRRAQNHPSGSTGSAGRARVSQPGAKFRPAGSAKAGGLSGLGLGSASEVVWTGASAGGIGSSAHVDEVAARLPQARVTGAPVAGFYWDNVTPYTGPGATEPLRLNVQALERYKALWATRPIPRACVEAYRTSQVFDARSSGEGGAEGGAESAWFAGCALLNFSLPFVRSDVFVTEFLIDSAQQKLHSGLPDLNASTADFVSAFGANMTRALEGAVVQGGAEKPSTATPALPAANEENGRDKGQVFRAPHAGGGGGKGAAQMARGAGALLRGASGAQGGLGVPEKASKYEGASAFEEAGRRGLFAPSCFKHTTFYSTHPLLPDPATGENATFISAFGDWYFGRGRYSSAFLRDECCADPAAPVVNPTCDGA